MDNIIIGILAGSIIVAALIIAWAITRGKKEVEKDRVAMERQHSQQFDTSLAPNTSSNVTAPLVRGGKKGKKPFLPTENEGQLAAANKDETFLPQTVSAPRQEQFEDDSEALTEQQKK